MSSQYFDITEHIVSGQYVREYADAVRDDQETTLQLHVKQYTPRQSPDPALPSVTILAAHGNGFPKEAYEPLWDELLSVSERAGFRIHGIWMADQAHQGQSYVLNERKISDDISWLDHSRDLLHITNHFRARMPRPIIGIGHSMGGAQLVYLASMHPRLIRGLVLLDPVIDKTNHSENPENLSSIMKMSTYRRDVWPSREEASRAIRRAPMYLCWDDRAWAAFVKHGLRDLPTDAHPSAPAGTPAGSTAVTLTTPRAMEVHTFMRANFAGLGPDGRLVRDRETHADVPVDDDDDDDDDAAAGLRPYPFYRPEPALAWARLGALRPAVLVVLGGTSFSVERDTMHLHETVGAAVGGGGCEAAGRARRVVLDGLGHGVPFEAPARTAEHCAPWVAGLAQEWREGEKAWLERRRAMPAQAHATVTDEWRRHAGPPPPRKKAEKAQSKI